MKQDGTVALFQYWNRLREGRAAPKRAEVEPADIKSLLADTFILEKDARGEAVFRLAGTRLCAIHGRELKGFSFPSLWREKDRRLIARLAHDVFAAKAVVVLNYEGGSRNDRTNAFEMLLLPLDGGEESPRCLGISCAAEKPFWLSADPIVEARLDSVRVVDPAREPLFLKNRPAITVPDLAPRSLPFGQAAKPGNGRRIRHLVVLEGGSEE